MNLDDEIAVQPRTQCNSTAQACGETGASAEINVRAHLAVLRGTRKAALNEPRFRPDHQVTSKSETRGGEGRFASTGLIREDGHTMCMQAVG